MSPALPGDSLPLRHLGNPDYRIRRLLFVMIRWISLDAYGYLKVLFHTDVFEINGW